MLVDYTSKRIAVIGLGVSNTPLIEFLLRNGATVCARDVKPFDRLPEQLRAFALEGVTFRCGEDYLADLEEDIIFKSPGIRFDKPELLDAVKRGAELTSEMELFFKLCPCKIIGVTGSDGKTTTTTLISRALAMEYGENKVYLGGNIGRPLLPLVEEMTEDCFAVVELSSFQLHTMKQSPHVAVVTNLSPNHLDWHIDMEEYRDAKRNITRYQKTNDRLVVDFTQPLTAVFDQEANEGVSVIRFNDPSQIHCKGNCIYDGETPLMLTTDIRIPGKHNVLNYMAVIAALKGLVDIETILTLAREFPGVPHRIEFVRELDGVKYYNSSIDSSPSRTSAALSSFTQKVIPICGGYDKKIPFEPLADILIKKAKAVILTGATADKIEKTLVSHPDFDPLTLPIIRKTDFTDAVNAARLTAKEGDIVILSPACASFDAFPNFEVRGNTFKNIVLAFEASV